MDKYKPMKILGEGSFGKVYLMRHIQKRELCCLKVMKIKKLSKTERENCRNEVQLMKQLVHPNIVLYRESFLSKNKDSLCICMEYCDGGDLSQKIERRRGQLMEERIILSYFVQMALGLDFMHRNRVLHRDLKTQNIFMLGNGRVVLGDLGISKVMEGTNDFARTCIGTPYYMSPEIFKNKPYNHKSDIWALGCVLYEMTTLNHAFDSNSLNGLASKIVKGKYPRIHPNFSTVLAKLINDMLEVKPKDRPDLEVILRKALVKRHVSSFFADISRRKPEQLGQGTIALNKVGERMGGALEEEGEKDTKAVQNLVAQLESLDMKSVIAKAVKKERTAGKVPKDEREAKRKQRDQADALKREEERRANVEAALQRLRQERAERAKNRRPLVKQQQRPQDAAPANQQHKAKIPVWQHQPKKQAAPDLVKFRHNEVMKSAAQRRAREKEKKEEEEHDRAREEEQERRKRQEAVRLRREKQAKELEEWERQQQKQAEEESRRRLLRIAADNARKKQEEEELKERQRKKQEQARKREEKRRKTLEQLRKDKEELDRRDMARAEQEAARKRESEAKAEYSPRIDIDAKDHHDPNGSPIAELPVVYSSLESADGGGLGKTLFSQTGSSANALVKDPFAKAEQKANKEKVLSKKLRREQEEEEKEIEALNFARQENERNKRAAAILQQAQYASDNVLGALNGVGSRFDDIDVNDDQDGQDRGDAEVRGGRQQRNSKQRVAYESDDEESVHYSSEEEYDDDDDDDDDIDMTLLRKEVENDSSDEEEEDATLQKRAQELENELTYATERCVALKATLEATKLATENARKQGMLSPAKPRAVVKNMFAGHLDAVDDEVDEEEGKDAFDVYEGDDGYDDDYLEDSLEESYDDATVETNDSTYYSQGDNTFAVERAEAKRGPDSEDQNDESKSLYQRRAEAKPRHIVTPRVTIDNDDVEPPEYKELSDAVSPSARIEDRVQGLRNRCEDGLGKVVFDRAYHFLKSLQDRVSADSGASPAAVMTPGGTVPDEPDVDDDEAVLEQLTNILGEDKLHYWSLVDQLLFCEDLRKNRY
ncbi:hypothetical protein TrST_g12903 [Triparma strigata]|uniref:non-specific serine/threonine protein kinase n=1 Tax=Triparma strigata TaxID=1606541 RepID=A0A9W7B5Q4_9STRA|nr:hypothetical protein TrST_g12903 [Triparma strigata]